MGKGDQRGRFQYYEFFAGGGMVRAGLGRRWTCTIANDFDHKKCRVYEENWGSSTLKTGDIRMLAPSDLPGEAHLSWASFPCQDLSLAGGGAGLKGDRSGTFWPFWELMKGLASEERGPKLIVLENVCGALNSHGGKDFSAICSAFEKERYRCGAVVIDAALFVPQSRKRLFVIGIREDVSVPAQLTGIAPDIWHPRALRRAHDGLPKRVKDSWLWWSFPAPPKRRVVFDDLIEEQPTSVAWHTQKETRQLLAMMSDVNLAKVRKAKRAGGQKVGCVYKRTRVDENGLKVQRAEVRFDDVAGCLRTPAGGSSRQIIMVVKGRRVRSRLISARETARLMGLADSYELPSNYNEAYHLTGDGVAVPVVRHLSRFVMEPILEGEGGLMEAA